MSLIYAIGDVHGRDDLLKALLNYIEADARYWKARARIFYMGDIVDRGTGSRPAMDLVIDSMVRLPGSRLHLGNHDGWLLSALTFASNDHDFIDDWLYYGGDMTLHSYAPGKRVSEALETIRRDFGHHIEALKRAHYYTDLGSLIFAHAGIVPGVNMARQSTQDLLFIRQGFLNVVDGSMPVVVHGHTIFDNGPVVTENRISLDTGAYKSDQLSACRIDLGRKSVGFCAAIGRGAMVETKDIEPFLHDRGHGTVFDRLNALFADVRY